MPALALCAGYDAAGLPVGSQIAGRPLDEGRVLALGHALAGDRGRTPPPRPLRADAIEGRRGGVTAAAGA